MTTGKPGIGSNSVPWRYHIDRIDGWTRTPGQGECGPRRASGTVRDGRGRPPRVRMTTP